MLTRMPIRFLQDISDERPKMRAIALAFSIKARYRSSSYRFTISRIAQEYHIGRDTAKRLLLTLYDMGLVKRQGQSILFGKFRQGSGKTIPILPYGNIDLFNLPEVEKYLRLLLVYIKQSQIDYAANKLHHARNPETLKEFKSAKRYRKYWAGEIDRGQSIHTVSNVSGLGNNKAVQLLAWGEKKKLLVKLKRVRRVGFYDLPTGKYDRSTVFTWQGKKFVAESTILLFSV